jgi:hypothetical protein
VLIREGYLRAWKFTNTFKVKMDLMIRIMADVIESFCKQLFSMQNTFKNSLLYLCYWQ